MLRVKKFLAIIAECFRFISEMAAICGDTLAGVKVARALCLEFAQRREKGDLKDVDFVDYLVAVTKLVGDLAPYGLDLLGDLDSVVDAVGRLIEFKHSQDAQN